MSKHQFWRRARLRNYTYQPVDCTHLLFCIKRMLHALGACLLCCAANGRILIVFRNIIIITWRSWRAPSGHVPVRPLNVTDTNQRTVCCNCSIKKCVLNRRPPQQFRALRVLLADCTWDVLCLHDCVYSPFTKQANRPTIEGPVRVCMFVLFSIPVYFWMQRQ